MESFIHYFLHLGFPFFIAIIFFRNDWKKVFLLLLATMLVDLDHLLANPVFQADRCSIAFHPLHSYYAIGIYFLMLFLPKIFRIIGIGLLFHMFTDLLDCILKFNECTPCYVEAPASDILMLISAVILY